MDQQILAHIKGIILDMDGVLWRDSQALLEVGRPDAQARQQPANQPARVVEYGAECAFQHR